MRLLDRYIAASFLKNLGVGVLALTAFFLFQQVLLDLTDSNSFTKTQILYHALLQVPQVAVQMTPPAVLLATLLTLASLNRTQELIAMRAIGVSSGRIVGVLLAITFVVSCFSVILQDRVLPAFFRKRTTYYWREMRKKTDFFLDVRQNKIWYRSKNLIYNLRTFDQASQKIRGMTVYTFDDQFNLAQVIEADQASYTPKGWKLTQGTVTLFHKEDPFPLTQKFASKELLIQETPRDFQEIEKEVEGLRLREMALYIQRIKEAGIDTKAYETKLHSKISSAFVALVMCVLGVPFALRNRREGGTGRDIGLCLLFTFFYWLFYSVGLSLGTNGALPPGLAAWLPSILFAVLAAALIARQRRGAL